MIIAYIGLTIGKGSGVGSLVIDISEGCRIYAAKVKEDKVVLYDEEWNQVGREIEIK